MEGKATWISVFLRQLDILMKQMSIGRLLLVTLLVSNIVQMQCSPVQYTIEEELPVGRVLGSLPVDANLESNFSSNILNTLRYGLLPGKYQRFFSVEATTGLLSINSTIDRDVLCASQQSACVLRVEAAVTQSARQIFGVVPVEVTVLDKNDNSPRFSKEALTLSISESASLESRYMLPTAFDPDSQLNGIQEYDLYSGYGQFRLEETPGSIGSDMDIHLVLQGELDREKQDSYSLQLLATDGGIPPKTGTLTINVQIVDANDNSPVFDQTLYNISMMEDEEVNKVLLRVHASDHDEGQNGEVIYYFNGQTADLYGQQFGIDNKTGDISLKTPLDFQMKEEYQLVVTAQDLGPDALKAHAKVFVHVQDTNNHRPQITVSPIISGGDISVLENQAAGAIVGIVSVEDSDQGANGRCTCQIRDPNFTLRKIYNNGYKIITRQIFDREELELYSVLIGCQDGGSPQLRSTRQIVVRILDANDNAPVFTRRSYSVTIKENSPSGLPMVHVNATDRDIDQNARIRYKLSSAAEGIATIDSQTGVISNVVPLDHEKSSKVEFIVTAEDHGLVALSNTAKVSIIIIDVNDEAPIFHQPFYNFGTYENQDEGTEIGTVNAEDRDSAAFNNFTFSLLGERSILNTFRVNSTTGKITTRMILDREATSAYYLEVMARDVAPPRLSSSVSVTIYVADRNDNAPTITFPNQNNQTIQVSEYAPLDYIFTTVEAFDRDLGDNARLTYALDDGGLERKSFGVDPLSGHVYLKRPLKELRRDSVTLHLLVTDNGTPALSAFATLNVIINDSLAFADSKSLITTGPLVTLGYHEKIIVILGSVTAVLVFILVAAIVVVKRRQSRHVKEAYKHMQRVDFSQRMSVFEAGTTTNDLSRERSKKDTFTRSLIKDNKLLYGKPALQSPIQPNTQISGGGSVQGDSAAAAEQQRGRPESAMGQALYHQGGTGHPGRGPPLIGQGASSNDHMVPDSRQPPVRTPQSPLNILSPGEHDSDATSGCSAEVSNADSGHGLSEEGENHDVMTHGSSQHLQPPAVPPRTVSIPSQKCPVHDKSSGSNNRPPPTVSGVEHHRRPKTTSSKDNKSVRGSTGSHGNASDRHGNRLPADPRARSGAARTTAGDPRSVLYQPPQEKPQGGANKPFFPHLQQRSVAPSKAPLTPWADSQTQEDSDSDNQSSHSGSFMISKNHDPNIKSVQV